MKSQDPRDLITESKRLVIKIGTQVLVDQQGNPEISRFQSIVDQTAALHGKGYEILIVTSGAIACGLGPLSFKGRPTRLSDLQAAASVGQVSLIQKYAALFEKSNIQIGQVLLTHEDVRHRARHLNARETLLALLERRAIPIINENDTIATEEIRFGDNDLLASLVALLVDADLLILLSSTNGLMDLSSSSEGVRIATVEKISGEILAHAAGKTSALSTGGMHSKLQSAKLFHICGGAVVIADGRREDILLDIMARRDVGTFFCPAREKSRAKRKQWLSYFSTPLGSIVIDKGAENAILHRQSSLLPAGILSIEGNFGKGAVTNIKSETGLVIARGICAFSSEQIDTIRGKQSAEVASILRGAGQHEVVHRNNMVLMNDG